MKPMQEWFTRQIAEGLPALRGTAISGTLAVRQELINELLSQWLASMATAAAPSRTPPPDLTPVAGALKRAAVRAENGTVYVDFDVAV